MTIHVSTDYTVFDDEIKAGIIISESDGMIIVVCKDSSAYGKMDFSMNVSTARAFAHTILKQVENVL